MSRIVLTTAGSLGDLYPYIAVALGLRERGHEAALATNQRYQEKIESLGLGFHSVRPDCDWLLDPEKVRRLSHPRLGLLRVGREWLMPAVRESYEDTLQAVEGADLLVSMVANYAARLVAEKTGMPWASALHIPLGFFSAYDSPTLDLAPVLTRRLRGLGSSFWRPLFWGGKRASRFLAKPWYQLRTDLGLPPAKEGNPLADGHSPELVLALFSKLLAEKQPDWPRSTVTTGFPFGSWEGEEELSSPLRRFLDRGSPPIVFTLGSAVSMGAGSFYEDSIGCAKRLGRRAVLVVGQDPTARALPQGDDIFCVDYAPFSELFQRAAVVVHHGGVGTTGLGMRAGRPMLIVPHAWDQPDNGDRATRLGVARTLPRRRYSPQRAARALRPLLEDSAYSERALKVQEAILKEDGVKTACDAIEDLLLRSGSA